MATNSEPKWKIDQATAAEKAFRDCSKVLAERQHKYTKLKAREVRLLKISLPTTDDSKPGLELMHTSLDSAPPYHAISYCWGEGQARIKLSIIGSCDPDTDDAHTRQVKPSWIGVTESLAQMLAYLPRHCIPSGCDSSYIWVDQLCINQADLNGPEKTQQIDLMGEIYSRATQVFIWLGPGPDSATAERIVNIKIIEMSPLSTEDKAAIRYVWENAWFERTWVVQECCLARDRQLLVGLHSMSWEFTAEQIATQVWAHDLPIFSIGVHTVATGRHVGAVRTWQKFEEISNRSAVSSGLLLCSFLSRFGQYLKAREPKDRVLAFMSLWKPPSFDILATSEERLDQVYARFARSLIKDTRRLDLLAALRWPIRDNTTANAFQPSWVPKWDEGKTSLPSPLMAATYSTRTLDPGNPRSHLSDSDTLLEPSKIQWKASHPHDEHKDVSQEDSTPTTLGTRGKIICRIQDVFPPIEHHPHVASKDAIEQFQSSLNSSTASITIREAMEIIIECTELGRTDEISGGRRLHKFHQLRNHISLGVADPQNDFDDFLVLETSFAASPNLFESTGRRFFTTTWPDKTNTLHGLGPGWTEIGDAIAILHGARFPVILRECHGISQTYQVVGDCCILGIMSGEAVYWDDEKDADDIFLV